ncbi:hypothetical protein PROFUN_04568 [Planoprotostelium fungivorum]|uniref:Uncharacterized protein n=1 Tax=Planoprotostelium fungivorum TaxID=1890364 RepID=A0A2P6NBM2_9EUKA|nr:hypothetical protein PROFUN_04568 [Planoprotostelium fungivorum]
MEQMNADNTPRRMQPGSRNNISNRLEGLLAKSPFKVATPQKELKVLAPSNEFLRTPSPSRKRQAEEEGSNLRTPALFHPTKYRPQSARRMQYKKMRVGTPRETCCTLPECRNQPEATVEKFKVIQKLIEASFAAIDDAQDVVNIQLTLDSFSSLTPSEQVTTTHPSLISTSQQIHAFAQILNFVIPDIIQVESRRNTIRTVEIIREASQAPRTFHSSPDSITFACSFTSPEPPTFYAPREDDHHVGSPRMSPIPDSPVSLLSITPVRSPSPIKRQRQSPPRKTEEEPPAMKERERERERSMTSCKVVSLAVVVAASAVIYGWCL